MKWFAVAVQLCVAASLLAADWQPIAGGFPPSLNTTDPETQLQPSESPDCHGVDCTADGYLTPGSIISGVGYTPSTVSASLYGDGSTLSGTYRILLNRLWRASGSTLYYGAPWVLDQFVPQDFADRYVFEASIVEYLPAGSDTLCVFLAGLGATFVNNGADNRAFFQRSRIVPRTVVAASSNVVDVSGAVACSSSDGVYLLTPQETRELTRKVRGQSQFQNAVLTVDRDTQRLIGADAFVIDLETGKVFDYSSSGFRYTTPTITNPNGTPFTPQTVSFLYESQSDGTGTLQYKRDEEAWSSGNTVRFKVTAQEKPNIASWVPSFRLAGHEWTFRLTALSSGVKIRGIFLYSDRAKVGGYTGDS